VTRCADHIGTSPCIIAPDQTAAQVVLGVVPGRIVFQTDRDGNNEIYIMNGDGTSVTRLTDNPADDVSPMLQP